MVVVKVESCSSGQRVPSRSTGLFTPTAKATTVEVVLVHMVQMPSAEKHTVPPTVLPADTVEITTTRETVAPAAAVVVEAVDSTPTMVQDLPVPAVLLEVERVVLVDQDTTTPVAVERVADTAVVAWVDTVVHMAMQPVAPPTQAATETLDTTLLLDTAVVEAVAVHMVTPILPISCSDQVQVVAVDMMEAMLALPEVTVVVSSTSPAAR